MDKIVELEEKTVKLEARLVDEKEKVSIRDDDIQALKEKEKTSKTAFRECSKVNNQLILNYEGIKATCKSQSEQCEVLAKKLSEMKEENEKQADDLKLKDREIQANKTKFEAKQKELGTLMGKIEEFKEIQLGLVGQLKEYEEELSQRDALIKQKEKNADELLRANENLRIEFEERIGQKDFVSG